jgi:serine-type D-Ala-D-Ala carboxypeptidase/endopeptidase (penicillin-binding protein 4)
MSNVYSRHLVFLCSWLCSISLSSAAYAIELPAELAAQVRKGGANVGLAIRQLHAPKAQWVSVIDTPLNPASTMKLASTYAALSLLGPDFKFKTSVHLRGTLTAGVLEGDLVWRGSGDPKFVIEDLTEFVVQLRAAGLREIRGNLVLDDAQFEIPLEALNAIDGDTSQPYNVPPFAALMNFKATKFVITPQEGGAQPVVTLDPALADVMLQNRVTVVKGPCRYSAASLAVSDLGMQGKLPGIGVSGNYSAACGETSAYSAVLDHRQFSHGFFKAAWLAGGGQFLGATRIERGAAAALPVFAQWVPPRTAADLVRDANKFSNNVVTRHLLLQASAHTLKLPATVERSRSTLRSFLSAKQIDLTHFVVDNGSGLSRQERVSAKMLAQVLESAASSEVAQELLNSLPIVGVDGTMKSRLRDHPIAGNAWIKTGSLRDVRSVAGYVKSASGKWYVFVMLANGGASSGASALQDALLRWLYTAN